MRVIKKVLFALGILTAIPAAGGALGEESLERALDLESEKRYTEAREALDPLLAREPGHPRARLLDGILLVRTGHIGDAIGVFEALRRDHSDMTEPSNNLAVLYALQGRLDDAREILLAQAGRRVDAVVYANLGDVYTRLARRSYRRAREIGSGDAARREQWQTTAAALRGTSGESSGFEPRKREGATGDAPPAAPEAASPAASFCTYAGGFQDRHAVSDAALWLQSYGAQVLEVRHEERKVPGSYRVYLPPFASRAAAVAKLREIRDRGVSDVAVIGGGALANGISLGKYRNEDNMHRRVATLSRMGYAVRSIPDDVGIVDEFVVRAQVGGATAALDAAWASRFPGHSIRIADCT